MHFGFDTKPPVLYYTLKMKALLVIFLALVLFACTTNPSQPPATTESVDPPAGTEPTPETPSIAVEPEKAKGEFKVSQDVYEQTFEEIQELIAKLNRVISNKQFDRWITFLSKPYIRKYNSKETLNAFNQYPQLLENNIVLASLQDYFKWVVVPSRSQAELKEIIFSGENHVIAYSVYEGQRAKLYEFEKIDGSWMISISERR